MAGEANVGDETAGMAERSSVALPGDLEQIPDAASFRSPQDLLEELLRRARALVRADTAAILLFDSEREVLVARAALGLEEEVQRGVSIPLGRGFAGRVAKERRPVVIPDVNQADILNPLIREHGIKSLLGVPLLMNGVLLGVMHVGTRAQRGFSEHDQRVLQLAADRAAAAIERAQHYEQRRLAEALQRTLLPVDLPVMPGLMLAGRYLPATSGTGLGGDWYDMFPLPDGRVGLVIGDVVGRGIPAATRMAQIRTALRAYAMEGHPPGVVAERLNAMLVGRNGGTTATLGYFAFDQETSSAVGVGAGHLPPLVAGPDGAAQFIDLPPSPPLGATRSVRYEEGELAIPSGGLLMLYTDGLVERRDMPLDAGMERLLDIAAKPGLDPVHRCDHVLSMLAGGPRHEDDIAVMVAQTAPLGDQLEMNLPAEPEVLASMRRQLWRWLKEMGVDQDVAYDAVLASSEAAANAIEHAYPPGPAAFHIDARGDAGELLITVSDRGTWRPAHREQRGRGLMLMHELMDEVNVVQGAGGGTRVTLRRRFAEQ